jgi:cellulose synthase/poly-beta-1,6-N-acetylglucosamine synthase-like glycosyltransferase
MKLLIIAFWACLFLVFYTYMGYGIFLYVLVLFKRLFKKKTNTEQTISVNSHLPLVTLMICAYNEEDVVKEKMQNIRQLNYPKDKLCVMWVTDGSTDHTNELLADYPEVKLVFSPERNGKAAAMQHGLMENIAEFVVFTDANTMLNADAIYEIMQHFSDSDVGCVSGEKRVAALHQGETAAEGEGAYWKYESKLKKWDSELYSAMGAAGELFAVRMSVYESAPSNALLDDFMISMLILKKGYKIAYTSDAYAVEHGSSNMAEESKRKRRIAAGGLQSIWWLRCLMNPFKYPVVAFQFTSHRVLRWSITPLALVVLIPLNIALIILHAGLPYVVIGLLQLLFYGAAIAGYYCEKTGKKNRLFYIPYYFVFMNINVFQGIKYLQTHKAKGVWEKSRRA